MPAFRLIDDIYRREPVDDNGNCGRTASRDLDKALWFLEAHIQEPD